MALSPDASAFKSFWTILAVLAAAALLPTPSLAQSIRTEITGFGEYGTPEGSTITAPRTARGSVQEVPIVGLRRKTDCIVARLGVKMGIQVRHRETGRDWFPVEVEVHHPPITGPDGQTRTVDTWSWELASHPLFTGWNFEKPYELVPGRYTVAVVSNGKVVARKDFTVVLPGSSCAATS
jgi:hypothetical protein